jgi:hypothetical protein
MLDIMQGSSHPKNFAIAAAYVFRAYPTTATKNLIRQKAVTINCNESQALMIYNLLKYLEEGVKDYQLPPWIVVCAPAGS